ncbi:MAG TPA: DUF411 domain-containing protein [Hyphomicrobiales bacterium]|jgi:hypothetical protein
MISRRSLLLTAAFAGFARAGRAQAETLPLVTVNKDPNCGCCTAWAEHLRSAGFTTSIVPAADMDAVKNRLGVPSALTSCHTAEVGGYVIEGHVPAAAIVRLLAEKPKARGLAVPDMPVGSPGMEVAGTRPEEYQVLLFGDGAPKVFARYKGAQEL